MLQRVDSQAASGHCVSYWFRLGWCHWGHRPLPL